MNALTLSKLALARLGISPFPLSLGFEITHRCNLRCLYCDRNRPTGPEMQFPEIVSIMTQFQALGMQTISLDGGEPLLAPATLELIQWLADRKIEVNMNSNGILVPRRRKALQRLSKLKISIDGPAAIHDSMRGQGAHAAAVHGIRAALDSGIRVELTCVLGTHNALAVDATVELAATLQTPIVFQPQRDSLLQFERATPSPSIQCALERVAQLKRSTPWVANRWSSLRHFRAFPNEASLPCAAGWINATLDPYGFLYSCGQLTRSNKGPNVREMPVRTAFDALVRNGCNQCWCARVVEENYAWGGRFDTMLAPATTSDISAQVSVLSS